LGTFSLQCHPKTPPKSVRAVSVDWIAHGTGLELVYRVDGAGGLTLPAATAPTRADGLWKTTCFELFLGLSGTAYREFNFAPSTQWAAYDFPAYRAEGQNAPITAPQINQNAATCRVTLPSGTLTGATRAGLTAVINEGGHISYWALSHAGPRPDFHDASCFTLSIAPAEAP
jgi:hypothetical protein